MAEQNNAQVIVCTSSWGLGTFDTGDPEFGIQYGFPTADIDPHDYDPDRESCMPKEIAAWEQAKADCKCGR